MLSEALNFAVVQTELDSVFYQVFDYDATEPQIATSRSADLFKPQDTTHAAYIEEIFKGSGLYGAITESQAVPLSSPKVANKLTTFIQDFAQGIELSKDFFDDNINFMSFLQIRFA